MLKEWFRKALGHSSNDDGIERKLGRHLEDGIACTLLRLVLENPGIAEESLAGRAHMDAGPVAAYLEKLADDGLIVFEQSGYHIPADAKAAVVEHLPLNYQCPGLKRD